MELSVSSKRPVSPSSTISGVPPRPVAITAVPHAIDSKNTRPNPSTTLLGDAKSIAPLYKLHNSSRDFGPSNWTRSDKRVSTICLSISSGPVQHQLSGDQGLGTPRDDRKTRNQRIYGLSAKLQTAGRKYVRSLAQERRGRVSSCSINASYDCFSVSGEREHSFIRGLDCV